MQWPLLCFPARGGDRGDMRRRAWNGGDVWEVTRLDEAEIAEAFDECHLVHIPATWRHGW